MQLNSYQEKKIKEINRDVCECCKGRGGNPRRNLDVHHITGDHKDNHEYDLIVLCSKCHSLIHNGFRKRSNLGDAIIENILLRRSFLLKKTYNNQNLLDRIKFERLIATNRGNQKRCRICGETQNIKPIIFDFVKRFDPENRRNLSYFLCKKCIDKGK